MLGDERLKADCAGGENCWGAGAGAVAAGMERSRRSPMPPMEEEEAAGLAAGAEEKEEKSPKPLDEDCLGGGDFGVESKKLPPPPNMLDDDAGGDLELEKLSSPANGEALGCWGCALKERPLKASFIPPKLDC